MSFEDMFRDLHRAACMKFDDEIRFDLCSPIQELPPLDEVLFRIPPAPP
jgi:hypothetical protein